MKKYNIKKLLKKYNKVFSEKYNCKYELLKDYVNDIDSLTSEMYKYWSDSCEGYLECQYLLKYVYFKYIENDIKDFLEVEI